MPPALAALAAGQLDAVVYDAPLLHYWIQQRGESELAVLPAIFEHQSYAIALPDDSPLRELLNRALLAFTADPAWEAILERYLGDGGS